MATRTCRTGTATSLAAGEAHGEVDGRRRHCTFTEVDDDAEHDECWDLLVAAYPNFASYQELTDCRLPVGVLGPAERSLDSRWAWPRRAR